MASSHTKPLLLFDLDGTLWDSAAQVADAWNGIFHREDPSLPSLTVEDIHGVMGQTMAEIGRKLHPSFQPEHREDIIRECFAWEVTYLRTHCGTLYPDFHAVMQALRDEGFALAIVSNCQRGYIDAFLTSSGTGDYFLDYEEWERTGLSKGENIRLVMTRNGYDRGIYIGDTAKDQEAARLAGVPFVHAAYGFGTAERPEGVIHALRELPKEIHRLASY